MAMRLGLDVGSTSIGWCLLEVDREGNPRAIRDIGVRIYPSGRDPQSGTSLAVDRRGARSARRRRDRYLLRRRDLMAALVRHGLMPKDDAARKALERLDPYELRATALDHEVPLHHLGRALFHLHQRRGFKSNRKAERRKDDDPGKIKDAGDRLAEAMRDAGARTLGEYLAQRHGDRRPVRARLVGEGAKSTYDFYPHRGMLEAEFDALWQAQHRHHGAALDDSARDQIRGIMFRQRPLRPVDPGKCALDPTKDNDDAGGFRAPWALPLAQRFRVLQDLGNLRYAPLGGQGRRLDRTQRDALATPLLQGRNITFRRARAILGLEPEILFNLESERRKGLDGDATAKALADKKRFGAAWHALDAERQNAVVERLLTEQDEEALLAWLTAEHGLGADAARAVAGATLHDGHARLGRRALGRIVPVMEAGTEEEADAATGELREAVLTYDKAAKAAGYHHSDRRPEDRLDRLPYYGEGLANRVSGTGDPADDPEERYGRIPNPTVHIGLNQLRRLVNAVTTEHGAPDEVVVELARELKLSQKDKQRLTREQSDNQRKNDERRAKLAELGQPDHGENRMRLRLYEELDGIDRRCVYTGRQIGLQALFSPAVEIDHILPFSMTLDNGAANRILCMAEANRSKRNRCPFDAFGNRPEWVDILARAEALPANKRWRFAPDAMQRFERDRDFLDRQLTDTAYLARTVKEYLGLVVDPNRVWVTPGRMTGMLRGKWGLNSLLSDHNQKNRVDHRHHAIDAFVAAVTSRGMLNAIARAAGRAEEKGSARLLDDLPDPFEGFREALGERLRRLVVSHRPDHGPGGPLHEETAYGPVRDPGKWDGCNVVVRKPVTSLSKGEVGRVRDPVMRAEIERYAHEAAAVGTPLKEALAAFSEDAGVRRVRVLKREEPVIAVRERDGRQYKALVPGQNHRIDMYEQPDGAWVPEVVSVFDANRLDGRSPPRRIAHPAARKVMSLYKGDVLKLAPKPGEPDRLMRIVRLSPSNNVLYLVELTEGGNLQQRHDDPDDPFRWLFFNLGRMREAGARKVQVDVLGGVGDPGPRS